MNAKEARNIANDVNNTNAKIQFERVLEKIKRAARNGMTDVIVDAKECNLVQDELEKLGYKIYQGQPRKGGTQWDPYEIPTLNICW